MSISAAQSYHSFRHIVIYGGHKANPVFGPYADNIQKRVAMFAYLNRFRAEPWTIETVDGDDLIDRLRSRRVEETLLVITAGQTSRLEAVFSDVQTKFLKEEFLAKGGRGYFNCGSAYWVAKERMFKDLCEISPEAKQAEVKRSKFPLFDGMAQGPLCPYPGTKYKVGFFSDAVRVTNGTDECSIYLSGGGSFIISKEQESGERVRVLLRYCHSELIRHKIDAEQIPYWENAAIMATVGKGAVLLSMFHPYYGPNDIDPETYTKVFADSGTDWYKVKNSLTPLEARMEFVYHSLIRPLEHLDFEPRFFRFDNWEENG